MILIAASNNRGKIKEIKQILEGRFEKILSLADAGINIETEETGGTFFENALIKAEAVKALTPYAVLADDSGLEVNALGGAPGIYSARYSKSGTDADNNNKLLENLSGITDRAARFKSVVVLIDSNNTVISGEGSCPGRILDRPAGENGFGYDPLFFSYDLNKSFGEAADTEKNGVSHRKKALEDLLGKL